MKNRIITIFYLPDKGGGSSSLKVEETSERRSWADWKQMSRKELIECMLPLVHHIVSRMVIYFPPHLSREDLVGAGVIGLIDAVDRYDETKGTSLKTYCSLRIKGSIVDELRRLDWIPRTVHREARALQEVQERLSHRLKREPSEEEVRMEMGLTEEDFIKMLDRVRPMSYFSLQEPLRENSEGDAFTHEDVVGDNRIANAAQNLLRDEELKILRDQLSTLPLHHQQVLTLYYMEDLRLKEIAEVLDLTESRVSQIHTLAVNRLRSAFERAREK